MRLSHAIVVVTLVCGCDRAERPAIVPPTITPIAKTAPARVKPTSDLLAGKIVDLTHPFDEQTIYWPTEKGFRFDRGNNGVTAKGYYYAANRFTTAEHGGTHLDAPIHFFEAGETSAEVPLERLIGEAAVVDVAEKCAADRDYQIGIDDLRAWEEREGRRFDDLIVLLRTGWSRHWPHHAMYLGTDLRGSEALSQLHFPGLSPEAARWLVSERHVKAIGIDTASIDFGQTTHFESHVALCAKNIPIFENVTDLDRLPATGATVIALPMKIAGGSGGPLRIVAIVRP